MSLSIAGYSTDPAIVKYINETFVGVASKVLVILHSSHGYDAVLSELKIYSTFVFNWKLRCCARYSF